MKPSPERRLQEQELVERARAGDEAAWVELVHQHQEAMFRLAYLHLADADDAQDAAQDALIRAHKYLARFDAERPLRPWLLSIVANLARNRKRGMGRYWNALARWKQDRPAALSEAQAFKEMGAGSHAIWQALQRLPHKDQTVIYLRYFLELSIEESAQALEIAAGTVKSRASRAVARLKDVIEAQYPELKEWIDE